VIRAVVAAAFLAVAIVVAASVGAWRLHTHSIALTVSTQAAAARTLVSAGEADGHVLAEALMRPGIHVVIEEPERGALVDAHAGRIEERPLPPGGIGFLPGEQNRLQSGGPLDQPPPQEGPGQGPPQGPQPRSQLGQLAARLAGVPPERIQGRTVVVHVTPDAGELGVWFATDAISASVALLAILVAAVWIAFALSRAAHARLEAVAEERRAAAAEFQRFLADAGHELRTPLTIVSGYVEILSSRADPHDPQMAKLFSGMQAETARMRALVEKMLLLARLETPVAVPSRRRQRR
jgi:hypothetical protein